MLVQGSPFLLAVYTHEVPLCLCFIFCSRSQVRLSTASYCVWSADHAPFVSRNLKGMIDLLKSGEVKPDYDCCP